jgi:putative spermidine/putrescine transport system ATP-binding protein
VKVYLRPEELRLVTDGSNGYNRLAGTVESVTFLGATIRLGLNVGDGILTVDLQNERQLRLPEVGQSQEVRFPPHACWVMPEKS